MTSTFSRTNSGRELSRTELLTDGASGVWSAEVRTLMRDATAHALWIGAIRHCHVIPSDRIHRIYKVTFGEGAHAGAPTGRADRRPRKLALRNGRVEPGGLEAAS